MTVILHLSDTHFGTENPEVLERLVESIDNLHADYTILSGDVTQRARHVQFKDATAFLKRLPSPIVIPGNHDIPLYHLVSRFLTPYKNYNKYFALREPVLEAEFGSIVSFDATTPYRHTRGILDCKKVSQKLQNVRSRSPEALLGVVVHQPILVYREEDTKNLLINAQEVIELFSEHQVDFVMSGHIHLPFITTTEESYPALPWQFIFSGAGTACSHRTRPPAPNSFMVIRANSSDISIERHDYSQECAVFQSIGTARFIRAAKGWTQKPSTTE